MSTVAIAGAGLSGAVAARALAEHGHRAFVFDSRDHVAGNCHTARDSDTGVMVHTYGPHIFHTANDGVWDYVNKFCKMVPYEHRVKATACGRVFSLPVNLLTINQFFGTTMGPAEAKAMIHELAKDIADPSTFEEQGLSMVGSELYDAFFAGYTRKQWGIDPSALPASILKRLPLRFTYDDRYFDHRYQGIPLNGYTAMVENILDHPLIHVELATELTANDGTYFDHLVWTGPIDAYFEHWVGRLSYRTLDFERDTQVGDVQGCAVMNYCDADVPFTRVTEFKHFTPWETHAGSVTYREYSRDCTPADEPYYPVRLVNDKALLRDYAQLVERTSNVTFLGRLGTYRYLDMDAAIAEAHHAGNTIARCLRVELPAPTLTVDLL